MWKFFNQWKKSFRFYCGSIKEIHFCIRCFFSLLSYFKDGEFWHDLIIWICCFSISIKISIIAIWATEFKWPHEYAAGIQVDFSELISRTRFLQKLELNVALIFSLCCVSAGSTSKSPNSWGVNVYKVSLWIPSYIPALKIRLYPLRENSSWLLSDSKTAPKNYLLCFVFPL